MLKDEEISYILNINKEKTIIKKKQYDFYQKKNIYNNYSISNEDNFIIEEEKDPNLYMKNISKNFEMNENKENYDNINMQYFITDISKKTKVEKTMISLNELVLNSRNTISEKPKKKLINIDNNEDNESEINSKNNNNVNINLDNNNENNDKVNNINSISNNNNEEFLIQNQTIKINLPKNKYSPFDNEYFNNFEDINCDNYNTKLLYEYFYNEELVSILIKLLDNNNNLKILILKIIIYNILYLTISKKDYNYINNKNVIVQSFISQNDKNKIYYIYERYKNEIINNYNNKKYFHNNAYKILINQYEKYIILNNIDYDIFIKEGYLLLSNNINPDILNDIYTNFDKNENKYDKIIMLFLLIHDFYFKLVSYENNDYEELDNNLFINNFPLINKRSLDLNKQYNLIDLDSNIKYYNCQCKIVEYKNNNHNDNFFYCYLLIYDNFLYIGDSSNNTSSTVIKYKFLISSCTIESDHYHNKNIVIYILDDINKQNNIEIYLDFKDYNTSKSIKSLIEQEIKNSKLYEKGKIKKFIENLK